MIRVWITSLVALTAAGANAQDAARGKAHFEICIVCHKLEPASSEHGPSLIGLVGRKAASLEDFRYSRALQRADIIWGEATLDTFLADPQGSIPGTRMPFGGITDKSERADLIAFLTMLR
jgi:cytochrome c